MNLLIDMTADFAGALFRIVMEVTPIVIGLAALASLSGILVNDTGSILLSIESHLRILP